MNNIIRSNKYFNRISHMNTFLSPPLPPKIDSVHISLRLPSCLVGCSMICFCFTQSSSSSFDFQCSSQQNSLFMPVWFVWYAHRIPLVSSVRWFSPEVSTEYIRLPFYCLISRRILKQ